jgi:hypothetical protein
LEEMPVERRDVLQSVLLELFYDALNPRHEARYAEYEPLNLPVPARYAAYTANLMILAVINGGQIKGSMLFPRSVDIVREWRNLALLWRSQLPAEGWSGMTDYVVIDRVWEDDKREFLLRLSEHPVSVPHYDQLWAINCAPDDYMRAEEPVSYHNYSIWTYEEFDRIERQTYFTGDTAESACVHALEPLANYLGGSAVVAFHSYWHDRSVSAANALINLWIVSAQDSSVDKLTEAFDECLRITLHGFAPFDVNTRKRFREVFLRQLSIYHHRLPRTWLESAAQAIKEAKEVRRDDEGEELLQMALEMVPKIMNPQ